MSIVSTTSPSSPPPADGPSFSVITRQHSRSSSQVATLASLALSPSNPTIPLPASPGGSRWRTSAEGGGAWASSPQKGRSRGGSLSGRVAEEEVFAEEDEEEDEEEDGLEEDLEVRLSTRSENGTRRLVAPAMKPSSSSTSTISALPSSTAAPTHRSLKDRRSTFPSLQSPIHVPALTSTSPSPVPSPSLSSPHLPPTDPSTPAQTSFPSSSPGLAQLIQQKRRQASAPYFASARSQSLFSPGAGFTVGPGPTGAGDGRSGWVGGWGASEVGARGGGGEGEQRDGGRAEWSQSLPPSRSRSRNGSRRGTTLGGLAPLQTTGLSVAVGDALGGAGAGDEDTGMVMTPTTEEWRQLGGKLSELADLQAKDEERLREREEKVKEEAKRTKNPLRPSLRDVSSDEDDDGDDEDGLGVSLSLGRFSSSKKNKSPLSHTPPPRSPSPPPSSQSETRPAPNPAFKSSFSYSSSNGGRAGGFVSHSNTSSISSSSAPLSSSSSIHGPSASISSISNATAKGPDSDPLPSLESWKPTHRPAQKSESYVSLSPATSPEPPSAPVVRPALSRGSLSATTGGLSSPPASNGSTTPSSIDSSKTSTPAGLPRLPLPPNVFKSLEHGERSYPAGAAAEELPKLNHGGSGTPQSTAPTPLDRDPFATLSSPLPSTAETPEEPPLPHSPPPPAEGKPVDLDWTKPLGPVDPRTYSAVTGLRDIGSFVVDAQEAGKGAYGSVRRARERGSDGKAVGPELIIKYVIKQRILADCWKKHKILGPIPIEVHVLDHLRRVPYAPRPARRRQGDGGSWQGQMVRRDSAASKVDLWTGGEEGGVVRTGHPNICGLLDFFEDGEFYYLVMPQATASAFPSPAPSSSGSSSGSSSTSSAHGQDLFDYVDLHPSGLALPTIRHILGQVADALAFLHEHSIVHRDIKDENVVLDAEGNVRLIDFGSAAYVREGRKFDTFSGTLDFAAPEVLKGARYGGKEQDVWALGVLGYVLICGECPFWSPDEAMRGLSPDARAYAALQAKLASSSPTPDSLTPNMHDAVDLVMRCLEIDPLNRPSADLVCDHVFLAGEGGWKGMRGWLEEEGEADVD
ncbi:hypothetical protein JCM21900_002895 [Sporobolomyces salmonicolor]